MFMVTVRAQSRLIFALPLCAMLLGACDDDYTGPDEDALPQATVVAAAGDITAKVLEYRVLLGDPANGGTAGEQPAGRREIAWDGAAANPFNNRNDFPADFFKGNGAVFTTPGTGFRNDSTKFVEIDASYGSEFETFTPTKIFSPIGSSLMDVHFRVAGSDVPASVTGFGVVFSDVDGANAATIEPFDATGRSLGSFAAPTRSDAKGLSFVGVKFAEPIIVRVRIRSGQAAIGNGVKDVSQGGGSDLVVMDNFLFGEPRRLN